MEKFNHLSTVLTQYSEGDSLLGSIQLFFCTTPLTIIPNQIIATDGNCIRTFLLN